MDIISVKNKVCELVFGCGQIMLNADRSKAMIDAKSGHQNFVTTYDKMIQDRLKAGLAEILPEAAFVGEEDEIHSYAAKGLAFIVDPIDGTTNFIKDYKRSCVSVGLVEDNEPIMGVIYNPYTDEMFSAVKGSGAFCNDRQIHVTDQPIENALVLFGTAPYYEDMQKRVFELAQKSLKKCIDVRRGGSAALDMVDVAAGRAEIYFEPRICPWDIAAGTIIVREAGGVVTGMDGEEISLTGYGSVCASNGVTTIASIG